MSVEGDKIYKPLKDSSQTLESCSHSNIARQWDEWRQIDLRRMKVGICGILAVLCVEE